MKDGKYEVGDWVKSSRSMMDITAGEQYRVVEAGESGFYVVDDVGDENWSSYGEGNWSLCPPAHQYKVGDWVKVIDNRTPGGMERTLAAGSVAKILHPTWMEGGWLLEGDERHIYTEKQLEPAEAPAPVWTPKVGDRVRATRASCGLIGREGIVLEIDSRDNTARVLFSGAVEWRVWLEFDALELVQSVTHCFKVGDRVSFKEWTHDGADRLTGTVTSVDKNGFPNECRRDDGGGWGDDSCWGVGAHHDLQMIAAAKPDLQPGNASTTTITATAPASGHTEIRLTLSLDMSEFADKLQRVVDAIRAAA